MRKYYTITIVFLCLLMSSFLVSAEVDTAAGFAWLNKTIVSQNWNRPNIDEVAISILALRNAGYDVSKGVDMLNRRKTGDNWGGSAYDTAWATLALYYTGNNVDRYVTWLQANDRKAYSDGNWLIQILTDGAGACMVEDGEGLEKSFTIDGTTITGCSANDKWIDVGACLTPVGKYHSFNVYCDFSPSNLLLLYKRDSNYYLIDDSNPLNLENACYGTSACDCGTSGYATWVLEHLDKDFKTSNYLETACDNTPLQNALLYEITEKPHYGSWLISPSHFQFGQYWGNFYDTAFVIGSLKQGGGYSDAVTSATNYLGNRQEKGGHWNNDLKTTAIILWRVFSTDLPPGTPDTPIICNYDGICDYGESYLNCPSDCNNTTNYTGNQTGGLCNHDDILDLGKGEQCDASYNETTNELIAGHVLNCETDQKCVDCTCQDVYDGPTANNTIPVAPDPSEACSASDECTSDTDCSWLGVCYYCDGFTCSCKEDTSCCEDDADCSYYLEECDVSTNTCIPKDSDYDPECELDSECSTGYICESGYCVEVDIDDDSDGGNSLWIWIVVLVVVIGVAAFYFFYVKKGGKGLSFGGKGKKKQTFEDFLKRKKQQDQNKQGFRPGEIEPAKPYYPPVKKVREDKFEKELDDSIKKARDLLRKK